MASSSHSYKTGAFAHWRRVTGVVFLFGASLLAGGCGGGGKKQTPGAASVPAPPQQAAAAPLADAVVSVVQDAALGPVVAGQVLVALPPQGRDASQSDRLAQTFGLKLLQTDEEAGVQVFETGGQGSPAQLLARLEEAGYTAGPNVVLELSGQFSDPALSSEDNHDRWGLEKIGAWPLLRDAALSSAQSTIALLDTGVLATHPELKGKVEAGPSFVGTGDALTDPHGHGTAMAGLLAGTANNGLGAAGVCPGCRVKSLRVCDAQGQCPASAVLGAMAWLAKNKVPVAHLPVNTAGDAFTRRLFENLASVLENRGVLLVGSAGNGGGDAAQVLPTGLPGVITVGALDQGDTLLAASNHGATVDLYAPGEGLLVPANDGGFRYVRGTSPASALAAGAAALLVAEKPGLAPRQLHTALKSTAAAVTGQAGGRLNLALARESLGAVTPGPTVGIDLGGVVSPTGGLKVSVTLTHPQADGAQVVMSYGQQGRTQKQETRTLAAGQREAVFSFTLPTPRSGVVVARVDLTTTAGVTVSANAQRTLTSLYLKDLLLQSSPPGAAVGAQVRFSLQAKSPNGVWQDVSDQASFTVTPVGALAPVDGEEAGVFTALTQGVVTVRADYGGYSRTLSLTLAAPAGGGELTGDTQESPGPAPMADGRRPAAPTRLSAQLQCPGVVFSWAAPTQDDTDGDGFGDSPLTGLAGYNLYSGPMDLGWIDAYLPGPLTGLSALNEEATGQLIPAVSYNSECALADGSPCNTGALVVLDSRGIDPNDYRLQFLDPVTLEETASIPVTGDVPHDFSGLEWDGAAFWTVGPFTKKIYKIDATTGTVVGVYPIGGSVGQPRGITLDQNGHFRVNDYQTGALLTLAGPGMNTGALLGSLRGPDVFPVGLDFDGTNLWVATHKNSVPGDIYRLNPLTGAVLGHYTSHGVNPYDIATRDNGLFLITESAPNPKLWELNNSAGVLKLKEVEHWPHGVEWMGASTVKGGSTTLVAVTRHTLFPKTNFAPLNFAVAAHDAADPDNNRNQSLTSAQVSQGFTCQPTQGLSATFVASRCGGENTVDLSWNDVDDDGIYRVYRTVAQEAPVPVTHGGVDQPVATAPNQGGEGVVNLAVPHGGEGQPSFFWVSSWDGCNEETAPVPLNNTPVVADCTPPLPPTQVVVQDDGENVRITWDLSPDDGRDVKEYHVYRATSPDGPFTHIRTVAAGVPECPDDYEDLDVVALRERQPWYYHVRAFDGVNESDVTGILPVEATPPEDATPPGPVTSVKGELLPTGAMQVQWTPPAPVVALSGGQPVTDLAGFNVYRSPNPSIQGAELVATVGPQQTTFTDTQADAAAPQGADPQELAEDATTPDFVYYFVEPFDQWGNRGPVDLEGTWVGLCVCKPKPPKSLKADNLDPDEGGRLQLTWDKSPHDNGVTFAQLVYEVYRRTVSPVSGSFELAGVVAATQSPAYVWVDDNGGALLANEQVYEYKVVAVGGGYPSRDSNTAQAQPFDELAPAAPTQVSVALQCPDVRVSWQRPLQNTLGQPVDDVAGYNVYRDSGRGLDLVATLPADGLDTVSFVDGTAQAHLAEHLTYSWVIEAFDDGLTPAGGVNVSSQSAVVSLYKECVEQPAAPVITQQCNPPPTQSTVTVAFKSGFNPMNAPLGGFDVQVQNPQTGQWTDTGSRVAYLGPGLTHSAQVAYPEEDGLLTYRVVAVADYGGGLTLRSKSGPATATPGTCRAVIEEMMAVRETTDCGYNGTPWYASSDPAVMAMPLDVTVAATSPGAQDQVYVADNLRRLIYSFDTQCLGPGAPSRFGLANTQEGNSANFTGTYAIASTNHSDFGALPVAETLLVSRNYGTTGYVYKCVADATTAATTAGARCVLDLAVSGQNIFGMALDAGPAHGSLYLTHKGRVSRYAFSGSTSRHATATRTATNPYGIDTDGEGSVYYSDLSLNRVVVLSADLSRQLRTLGGGGAAPGQFDQPSGIHVMKRKPRLFVADRNNHRVQVLDTVSGAPVTSFGRYGQCLPGGACQPGVFNGPRGVFVIENPASPRYENVMVADTLNHRAVFFQPPAWGF